MIAKQQVGTQVTGTLGADTAIKMEVSERKKDKMLAVLSQGLYSNPISSIVREIVCNGLDATKNSKEPVVVDIVREDDTYFFTVQDFGTGMSPQVMEDVYSKPLESTKEESNDEFGYFGLGSKSPLAYTDSFTLITISEGVKYTYIVFKDLTEHRVQLVTKSDTTEPNGTLVKIPIKDYEEDKFKKACARQLCYFKNVYINFRDSQHKIKEFKYFTSSEMSPKIVHINMGGVFYPIDYTILGQNVINLPFGIKVAVGDLMVTPNREQIIYDKDAVDLINRGIENMKQELIDLWKQNTEEKELSVVDVINTSYNDIGFDICDWFKLTVGNMRNSGASNADIGLKFELPFDFVKMGSVLPNINSNRWVSQGGTLYNYSLGYSLGSGKKIIINCNVRSIKKMAYLKSLYSGTELIINKGDIDIDKKHKQSLHKYSQTLRCKNNKSTHKLLVNVYKKYKAFLDQWYKDTVIDFNELEVPKDFVDPNAVSRFYGGGREAGTYKVSDLYPRYSKGCKQLCTDGSSNMNAKDFDALKSRKIVVKKSELPKANTIAKITNSWSDIVLMADSFVDKLEFNKIYNINRLMTNLKKFPKITESVTACILRDKIKESGIDIIGSIGNKYLRGTKTHKTIRKIENFLKKNDINSIQNGDEEFRKELVELVLQQGLENKKILSIFEDNLEILKVADTLKHFQGYSNSRMDRASITTFYKLTDIKNLEK